MPAHQPFTALCQAAAKPRAHDRADLHVHTVHSDGLYTPAQVIDLARRAGLRAVAITDHDTLAGVEPAQQAAVGLDLEVISGVEISSSYLGREIHLLGYFVDQNQAELTEALAELQRGRAARFDAMVVRLQEAGVSVPKMPATDPSGKALGRRSLAELLVKSGRVTSIREAFHRYLSDSGSIAGPKVLLEAVDALAIVRRSGGVASWAHPSYDFMLEALPQMRAWGLSAVEAVYPGFKNSKIRDLRQAAAAHGLAVTGGSDCHGPDSNARAIGAVTIGCLELELLRARVVRQGIEMVFRALLQKIKSGLSRTRDVFTGIGQLLRIKGKVDRDFLEELEKRLYLADVGTEATSQIVADVRQAFLDKEVSDDVEAFVKKKLEDLLTAEHLTLSYALNGPTVVLVAGVNGSGKTTSIAKLAYRLHSDGKKVLVAACDTFRAAAVEQLTIWSERIGCDIVKSQQGSDPASVAHDACVKAESRKCDVMIVDTAGRLHTQAHLMNELEKILRVVKKQIPGAPHEVLLVLDATTGQNALVQAQKFKERVQCTGIVLSKLDGTARGGAIFSIKQKLGLPVKFIGVGEKLDDLEPFDPATYVEALFAN